MSLLKVCAQIRRKATPIFFSNNAFRITNIFSEAVNFVKHARGRITKLYLSFELAPNKFKSWDRDIAIKLLQRVDMLPGFLLLWDVNPNAVIVERPHAKVTSDSAGDHWLIVEACDRFQVVLNSVASPERAGEIQYKKEKAKEMTKEMNKMKKVMRDEDIRYESAASRNAWKNTHIPMVGDEIEGVSKKNKNGKNGTNKAGNEATKPRSIGEESEAREGDAESVRARIREMSKDLHIF